MKQTKSALTMLLNAYRAVYKSAYFKGLASAVVLTAGLAAGAAQAGTVLSGGSSIPSDVTTIQITGEASADGISGEYQWLQLKSGDGSALTNAQVTDFTIASGDTSWNVITGNSLTLENATFNINDGTALKVADDTQSGSLSVKTLNIQGDLSVLSSSAAAQVKATTINYGTSGAQYDAERTDFATTTVSGSNASIGTLASTDDAEEYSTSTIHNVYGDAKIDLSSSGTVQGATLNILGGTVVLDTPAGSETASIKVADGRMDSGLLQVTSGNTVNFTLQDLQNGTVDSTATYADKIFTVNGGTIDVAGTLALSGGSASGDATFDFSNDALVLKASGASVTGVPKISVTGVAAGQTIFKISQANLTEYLNDADDETADNAGAIQVADYGVLELSDTDINLNDDVFVFAAAATPAAGKISVAQTATLRGQNITIDEALNGGDNFSGSIAATNLTLGSALDSLEGIAANASGYSVDEDIDLQADDFTIDKAITLGKVDDDESTTEVEDTIAGTLTGNNVTVAETVTVKANYTFDTKNLNLSGATINVGNGGLAELTLQGTLVLQDGSAANAVTVSGADGEFAVLDLSQLTDIDNQHASKLSTFTASGNGTIKIDGTDLGELASGDHTAQSGAAFVIKEGTLEATSDVALNVANLVSANAANASGNSITFASDATASTINTFKVDGDLTLQADTLADDKLNIGASGAIVADTLALNIADTTDLQADSDDIFTVSAGTLTVNQGLSSNTDGVLFDGTTTTSALNLGAADNEVLADDVNGTVNTDLTFSGGSAKLIANDGTWTVQDLALQAGAVATIGQASFNTANANAMAVETSFTAQNVQISGASSALTVNATAAASINALNIADGATGITVSGGTLTLHGADYSADDEATQALAVTFTVYPVLTMLTIPLPSPIMAA